MLKTFRRSIGALGLVMMVLMLGACNLAMQQVTPTSAPSTTEPSEQATTPSFPADQPTSLPASTQSGIVPVGATACVLSTNLPTYVVAAGDTLNGIAQRNGTTVSALMSANCLTDPNVLAVGQTLAIPGSVLNYSNIITVGAVQVSPVVRTDSGALVLTPGQAVTLSWNPGSGKAGRIEFYFASTGTSIVPSVIGVDENAADGGSIQWVVPGGMLGYLSAQAVAVLTEDVWARTATDLFVIADGNSSGASGPNITLLTPAGGSTISGGTLQLTGTAVGIFESTFTLELRAAPSGTVLNSIQVTYSTSSPSIVANWSANMTTGNYNGDAEVRAIYNRPSDGAAQVMASVAFTLKNL